MTAAALHDGTKDESRPVSVLPSGRAPPDWLSKLLEKHPNPVTPRDLTTKALCVAPMVDQSDLPFRLLCRKYGANIAVTPMIHCKSFCTKPGYQLKFMDLEHGTPKSDRPVIAQLCGSDPQHVLRTAKLIEPHVDAIDLNCGCPQNIAKKGNYGAFLLEQPEILLELVRELSGLLSIPLSVKVRILLTGVEESLRLYQKLVDAGASMITIHGRTRLQKGPETCRSDWNAIRRAVQLLHPIPVLANGSMQNLDEVRDCLHETGAAGVMCSEALLEYPPIFTETNVKSTNFKRVGPGRLQIAQEYMNLATTYPPHIGGQGRELKCVRMHLHRFLHADLQSHTELRTKVQDAQSMQDLQDAIDELREIHGTLNHVVNDENLSWYMRNRLSDEKGNLIRQRAYYERQAMLKQMEVDKEESGCMSGALFGSTCNDEDGDY